MSLAVRMLILLIHHWVLLVQYHVVLLRWHLTLGIALAFRRIFITLRGVLVYHESDNSTIVSTKLRGRRILLLKVSRRTRWAMQDSWRRLLALRDISVILVLEKASDLIVGRIVGKLAIFVIIVLTRRGCRLSTWAWSVWLILQHGLLVSSRALSWGIDRLLKSISILIRLSELVKVPFSLGWRISSRVGCWATFTHDILTCPRLPWRRNATSVWSLLLYLRLVSWIWRVGANRTLIAWKIAIIVVEILVFSKGVWRPVVMISTWRLVITSLACIDSMNVDSMCSTSWSHKPCTTTHSLIMVSSILIHLRWRGLWLIDLRMPLICIILPTVLVTVTNDFLSLIVESRVLLSMMATIESVRAEEHLVTTFIISSMIATSLPVASSTTSHHHWWLACGDARPELLLLCNTTSIRVILMVNILLEVVIVVMRTTWLVWWRMRVGVFAHDWTSNKTLDHFTLRVGMNILRIVSLIDVSTVLSSRISSVASIFLIVRRLLLLRSSWIKVLSRATVVWHVQSILNARRPLSLSVSHWEMWIRMS